MSEIQFFQTKMGRQFFEVTMPELVRQIHRLNDLVALAVEMSEEKPSCKKGGDCGHQAEDH
ncbi:MAG: hypothetical protein KOO61_04765 [Spirochaetales bacterium]|nr:hypothetical protein [Spirochaetales bacterium]